MVDDGTSVVGAYEVMDGRMNEADETSEAIDRVAVDVDEVAVRNVVIGAAKDLKRPARGVIRGMMECGECSWECETSLC